MVRRYIFCCFFKALTTSFLLFFCILFLFHLFGVLDDFLKEKIKWDAAIRYLFFMLPYIFMMALPVASLFATFLCVGRLEGRGEILGMYSVGHSPSLLLSTIFASCTLLVILQFFVSEVLLPPSMECAQKILGADKERKRSISLRSEDGVLRLEGIKDGRIEDAHKLILSAGYLKSSVYAKGLKYKGGEWRVEWMVKRFFKGDLLVKEEFMRGVSFPNIPPPHSLLLLYESLRKDARSVSARKMLSYIKNLSMHGVCARRRKVEFHIKLAFPFSILALCTLALSFVVQRVSVGFGLSLFCALTYWFFLATTKSLGAKGLLPPAICAWLPNILSVTIAIGRLLWCR
jgi:lipopolysaccharide export system permease protein